MTFPDQKFTDAAAYTDAYFAQVSAAAATVDRAKVEAATTTLSVAYATGQTVYVCGNGGSAAIANHLVCDHCKGVATDTPLMPRVVSLSTNIEVITAIANDISYDEVFAHQLKYLGTEGDILVTVSSSGDSENVVRAATWAKDNGLTVISLTGFEGGRSGSLADIHLHVAADNYGVAEDVHQSLMHILAQYIRQAHMEEAVIQDRKF